MFPAHVFMQWRSFVKSCTLPDYKWLFRNKDSSLEREASVCDWGVIIYAWLKGTGFRFVYAEVGVRRIPLKRVWEEFSESRRVVNLEWTDKLLDLQVGKWIEWLALDSNGMDLSSQ